MASFRDRSPLHNAGGRFRPEGRPGPPPFGQHTRPGGPRPDWRDRERTRFENATAGRGFGPRGGSPYGPPRGFGRGTSPSEFVGGPLQDFDDLLDPRDILPFGPRSDMPPRNPFGARADMPSRDGFGPRDLPPRDGFGLRGETAARDGFLPRGEIPHEREIMPPAAKERWTEDTRVLNEAAQVVSNDSRTNDSEIIVTHKSLTDYAEYIERRLKKLGLTVDLLFPNEEVPLGRVLANIANRGTLYAIVVTQLSEENTSVTVNILYGQTQEHRNMPLEDGLLLISRNFDLYTRGNRTPIKPAPGGIPVNAAGEPLSGKHPDVIQSLLSMLADNKPLTVTQFDKVISYLQDRRELQVKMEVGEGLTAADANLQQTQVQLQNRILDILKSSEGNKSQYGSSQANNRNDYRDYRGASPVSRSYGAISASYGGRK